MDRSSLGLSRRLSFRPIGRDSQSPFLLPPLKLINHQPSTLQPQLSYASVKTRTNTNELLPTNNQIQSLRTFTTVSSTQEANDAPVAVRLDSLNTEIESAELSKLDHEIARSRSPPPRYPNSKPSGSAPSSPRPPPFSSLYTSTAEAVQAYKVAVTEAGTSSSVPAYSYAPTTATESRPSSASSQDVVAETKAALPQDTKGASSKKDDDAEPPPAYSEGSSPLDSFTYLMAAAGGAASILTQVQQGGPLPINTLGGWFRHYGSWQERG